MVSLRHSAHCELVYNLIVSVRGKCTNGRVSLTLSSHVCSIALTCIPFTSFRLLRVLDLNRDDDTQTGDGDDGNGMGAAIYAGAAAAGVLLIIGIIVIIVLWRRRKPSSDGMVKCFFITGQCINIPMNVNSQQPSTVMVKPTSQACRCFTGMKTLSLPLFYLVC